MYQPLSWALTIYQQSHLQTRISLHLFIPCILQFLTQKSLLLLIDFLFLIKWFFLSSCVPNLKGNANCKQKFHRCPLWGSPILFLRLLLCMKHQWRFIFSVIGEPILLHPQETAFWFFRDPSNLHLLNAWFVN